MSHFMNGKPKQRWIKELSTAHDYVFNIKNTVIYAIKSLKTVLLIAFWIFEWFNSIVSQIFIYTQCTLNGF